MAQRKAGVTLILSLALCGASAALILSSQTSICNNRPALTVLAMAGAFVVALCFRLLATARRETRRLLYASATLASIALLVDVRFVMVHRKDCAAPLSREQTYLQQTGILPSYAADKKHND